MSLAEIDPETSSEATGQTAVVGIIGCGARLRHIGDLLCRLADRKVQFAYVFDPSERSRAQAAELLGRPAAVSRYSEMLEDPRVSWVMIGSPNHLHAEHAIAALRAGKDVFCEKPLATTVEDCLAIRDAVRASGRQFVVGFTLRYSPFYREVHRLVSAGTIGKLISFEFNETLDFNHGGYILGDWRRLTSLSGGHLLEKCCHDIDIANWIVGSRASRVASFGGLSFFVPENDKHIQRLGKDDRGRDAYRAFEDTENLNPFTADKDIVDHQVAILEYANGVRATFHTNCNSGLPERRIYLCGSEGAIRADVIGGRIEHRRIGFRERTHVIDMNQHRGGHGGGDQFMATELAACMLGRQATITPLETGLIAAVTCIAVDEARRAGGVIDLAPIWKKVIG
jgi:predicted dehydrogenase